MWRFAVFVCLTLFQTKYLWFWTVGQTGVHIVLMHTWKLVNLSLTKCCGYVGYKPQIIKRMTWQVSNFCATVWSLRSCYNQWPACEATTWISYADEEAQYCGSSSSRSFAVAKWHSKNMFLSVSVWYSSHFWSAYLTVALDWFVIHTYSTNKYS